MRHPWWRRLANPADRFGGYLAPHLTLLALVVVAIVAFAGGFAAGSRHCNSRCIALQHAAPLIPPSTRVATAAPPATLASSGGIHFRYWRVGINDQGPLGSCESWTYTKSTSYAVNWNKPHTDFFGSARFNYDQASPGGGDNGSYLEQYPPITAANGCPTFADFPYGAMASSLGLEPYRVDNPVPAFAMASAQRHRLVVTEQQLFYYPGAGAGGLQLILQQLASHHAVAVDFPVYPEYDAAASHGRYCYVDTPLPGEVSRGGHANAAVAYKTDASGAIWVLFSNQWGFDWGCNRQGTWAAGHGGYVWVSAAFIEQYVWDAAVIHVQAGGPRATPPLPAVPPPFTPTHRHTVPPPASVTPPRPGTHLAWYVNQHAPWYRQVNAYGDRWHIWPVGLEAVAGAESGYRVTAERWGVYPDWSCGPWQESIPTAQGYGVRGDARAVCTWEEVASHSGYLAGHILHDYATYEQQRGCYQAAQWPAITTAWNAGPANACSFLLYPTGQAGQNRANYVGWLNYVEGRWQWRR